MRGSGERLHGMQEVTGSIPVISTRTKSTTQKCVVLFVSAKRVRAQFTRESAVHGLQEGHRDLNRPGNLHQKEKHYTEMCGAFLLVLNE